jgi:purine-cytosine permease-like protein
VEDLKFGKLKIKSYINIMEKLSKYKKQIVTFITIFLLATYGIFPALTAANTFLNILGGVGALLFLIWGGLALYEYATNTQQIVDEVKPIEPTKEKTKRKPKTK